MVPPPAPPGPDAGRCRWARPAVLALSDPRLRGGRGARGHAAPHPGRAGRRGGAGGDRAAVAERRQRWAAGRAAARGAGRPRRAVQGDMPIDMAWVSRAIGDVIDDGTLVVNEYDLDLTQRPLPRPGSYFAARRRPGSDGAWAPRSARSWPRPTRRDLLRRGRRVHLRRADGGALGVARLQPAGPVRRLQQPRVERRQARGPGHAPKGWASRASSMVLSDLDPAPDYELICQASGGYGERVEDPAKLPDAMPGAAHGAGGAAPGPAQRDLQEAMRVLASGPSGPATSSPRSPGRARGGHRPPARSARPARVERGRSRRRRRDVDVILASHLETITRGGHGRGASAAPRHRAVHRHRPDRRRGRHAAGRAGGEQPDAGELHRRGGGGDGAHADAAQAHQAQRGPAAPRGVGAPRRPRRVPLRQDRRHRRPRPHRLARRAAAGGLGRAAARRRSLRRRRAGPRARRRAGRSADAARGERRRHRCTPR